MIPADFSRLISAVSRVTKEKFRPGFDEEAAKTFAKPRSFTADEVVYAANFLAQIDGEVSIFWLTAVARDNRVSVSIWQPEKSEGMRAIADAWSIAVRNIGVQNLIPMVRVGTPEELFRLYNVKVEAV